MKLLVTGASGLIGGAVARAAAAAGIETVACGRRTAAYWPATVARVALDLTDPAASAAAVHAVAPTHLVHAAWETRHPTYWRDPANLDWVAASAAMARAFGEAGGVRYLQVGSCAEYAWAGDGPRRDGPATLYGKAKLAAFRTVEARAHDRFAAVEARIFWVYGPGENASRFIPLLCRSYAAGVAPDLGSGRQIRDLLYVDDAARAILALLEPAAPAGVVDIGAGAGTRLAEVAEQLAGIAGVTDTGLGRNADRADDPAELVADPTALRSIGWRPRVPLHDGLRRAYASWQTASVSA